jgi:hypothetical protein
MINRVIAKHKALSNKKAGYMHGGDCFAIARNEANFSFFLTN